jgi:MFS family permease
MTGLSANAALRRYLILTALRWIPPGLVFPVLIMLPLSRGLSLSELGLAAAMQGLVVFALELPTGGLADSLGRRPVLVLSTVVSIVSIGLFLVAHSFASFAIAFALQGVYRALDSGPLDAWYVDTARSADPDAPIGKGMSAQGTVLGVAIAAGSLASGGLVALHPIPGIDPLVGPVIFALAVQVVGLTTILLLMTEQRSAAGIRGVMRSVVAVPSTIAAGVGLLRQSRVLLALVGVELFWGFGMVCFESLMPVRLAEVVGGNEAAAAVTGPVVAVAWIASAGGSAVTPLLTRWIGVAPTAALMRVLQGITVAGMGFFAGLGGIIAAYIACNAVHGTSNAVHMTLLHRQAEDRVRATVVSLNSWISQPAGALGVIVMTAFAQATSVSMAMYVGAIVLAAAAPLYLPAWRQSRMDAVQVPAPRAPQPLDAETTMT